jgi:hypothetical protein
MLNGKWKIVTQCPLFRVHQSPDTDDIAYCNLDNPTECSGDIELCEHPEAFHKYLLDRGLGWQKIKTRDGLKNMLQAIGHMVSACWR